MDNPWSEIVTLTHALPFIAFFLFGLYYVYGISQHPLPTNDLVLFKPYLFLYLSQLQSYDYKQPNAQFST